MKIKLPFSSLVPLSFIALLFLVGIGCKSQSYTVDSYQGDKLYFGDGGGYAGVEKTYCLLGSGDLFLRSTFNGEFEHLAKLSKGAARKLLKEATALELAELDFQFPGNMYKFIEIPGGDSVNRIAWGIPEKNPDQAVLDFYQSLYDLIPGPPTE